MAVSYIFDTKYHERRPNTIPNATQGKYRIVIGDKSGTVTASGGEMDLMDPGMSLSWSGDQDRFMNAIMGSSLTMTVRVDDAQLAIWDDLLDLNEGNVFCLFFNNWNSDATAIPYWYGHLLVEETTIKIDNKYHIVDLTFTDGLGSLRGQEWVDNDGSKYTGFKKLKFYVKEIVAKLPAYDAFYDWVNNVNGDTYVPVCSEIGFPDPRVDNGTAYDFHSGDSKLNYIRVRAETFEKPKKQSDRTRELEAAPDYFDTGSVLEDICKTFGATACIFDGRLNLGCRLDISTLKGQDVVRHIHSYNRTSDQFTSGVNLTAETENIIFDPFYDPYTDSRYQVSFGATKKRTLPIRQVNLTHEEGGSDWLVADGYYLHPNISHLDLGQMSLYAYLSGGSNILTQQTGSDMSFFSIDGNRRDLWYVFRYFDEGPMTGGGEPPVGASYTIPWYQFPASVQNYSGFPARTVTDLEVQSGEAMRIQFGGEAKFSVRGGINISASDNWKKFHIGNTLIHRSRIQFKDTDGYYWRLRRVVKTHVMTNGSTDWVRIDNIQLYYDPSSQEFVNLDRYYFRKIYDNIAWVRSDQADYDDAWYELMIPHGDTVNSGDGFGTTAHPLTDAEYGSQTNYAPIGTKVIEDGAGNILEEGDDDTLHQYFKEDITVTLPYYNNTLVDFEEFYFEQGFELYQPDHGPRPNTAATNTGNWVSDTPVFRTPNADGTGGVDTFYGDTESWRTRPIYLHCVGVRVAIGDGSESSDFVTKIDGGDGYEISNIGSSRLGSRLSFVNTHVGGTLWARTKLSDDDGDFDFANEAYIEKLQWRGHRAGDVAGSQVPTTVYDSLHSYVCNSYIDLFGENRVMYDMTLIPGEDYRSSLQNPFTVLATKAFVVDKSLTEYLMPMGYTWTMNEGVQGSFLKVGQSRERAGITEVVSPRPAKGTFVPGGVTPGIDLVSSAVQSRIVTSHITVTQDIDLDAEKDRIDALNAGKDELELLQLFMEK